LYFALYEREGALQCVIREARELEKKIGVCRDYSWNETTVSYSPTRYTILPTPCCLAFEAQFHIANFESVVACKPHLERKHQTEIGGAARAAFTEPVV